MPKQLGFQWSEEGSSGTILEWVSRGQDRAEDMILKISEHNQEREKEIAQQLPGIAAKVYWTEDVEVVLHGSVSPDQRLPMTILCQERCVRAVEILTARGAIFSYHWLCYVGCMLVLAILKQTSCCTFVTTSLVFTVHDLAAMGEILPSMRMKHPGVALPGMLSDRCDAKENSN